jgi:hypothetical protein
MDRTYIKIGWIAALVLAVLIAPVCAQPGNPGHSPIYPQGARYDICNFSENGG